jgi:hypothetical protein
MDIVEKKVAAVIDDIYCLPGVTTHEAAKRAAKRAIRATLEHYRDNVSEGMIQAALDASDYDVVPDAAFRAMINRAIEELLVRQGR